MMAPTARKQGDTGVDHTVGIGEMAVSDRPNGILKTYSLGSCVALSVYDPGARIGGLIHCMLPLSRIDPVKAAAKPAMFTDTGVLALIEEVLHRGADLRRLVAKAAGGASLLDDNQLFRIGERNCIILRKVLWKNNVLLQGEDLGGTCPRSVFLDMATGATTIKSEGRETVL